MALDRVLPWFHNRTAQGTILPLGRWAAARCGRPRRGHVARSSPSLPALRRPGPGHLQRGAGSSAWRQPSGARPPRRPRGQSPAAHRRRGRTPESGEGRGPLPRRLRSAGSEGSPLLRARGRGRPRARAPRGSLRSSRAGGAGPLPRARLRRGCLVPDARSPGAAVSQRGLAEYTPRGDAGGRAHRCDSGRCRAGSCRNFGGGSPSGARIRRGARGRDRARTDRG